MDRFFPFFHNPSSRLPSSRWLLMLAGSVVVCVLAAALVLAQTAMSPVRPQLPFWTTPELTGTVAKNDAFAAERLEAFSGRSFNLLPDLPEVLRIFAASLPAPTATEDELQRATVFTNPEVVRFTVYTIRSHDNFWKMAKERGYTIDTIVGCNPLLEKVVCRVGQKILLPSRGGCLHAVEPGETLDLIALQYRVNVSDIEQANRLDSGYGLVPGMLLFIPGAKPLHLSPGMLQEYARRALFRSPLSGRYTSFVGMRLHPVLGFSKFHNGVDIACRENSWVGAAASGTVVVSGWGGAIGKCIKLDHHNGYQTIYGHLSRIFVRQGQEVKGGQLIARSGSTGRSTGPHLHFTIWDHGRVRDPMDYLW
jgi:LysM repeat protein